MKWLGCATVFMVLFPMFFHYRTQTPNKVGRVPHSHPPKTMKHTGSGPMVANSRNPEQLRREEAHLKLLLIQASMRNQNIAQVVAANPSMGRN